MPRSPHCAVCLRPCARAELAASVERRIRPFAVARRNFLFTGSPRGDAFTLVYGYLLLGLAPYEYLIDVIRKLEDSWPTSGSAASSRAARPPTGD